MTPRQSSISKDEEMIKGAADAMESEDSVLPQHKPPKTRKSKKKLLIVLLVLLILGIAGFVGWRVMGDQSSTQSTSSSNNGSDAKPGGQANAEKTYAPNAIAYAFKPDLNTPYTVFSRPAIGGDRAESVKLDRDYSIAYQDTARGAVIFGNDSRLYVSSDSGKTYSIAYEATAGEAINSAKLSFEGDRIALGVIPNYGDNVKGKVISIDLKGKDKQEVFEADKYAIYLIGWSQSKQKMAYSEGCYGCDGGRTGYKLRDIKTKQAKDLIPGVDVKSLGYGAAVSSDMSKVVYVESTYDDSINTEGPPGYYAAAPYNIRLLDVASTKSTDLDTIGTKSEKNANGTDKYRQFILGFLADSNTPFYAEGTTIKSGVDTKVSTVYEAEKPILHVLYVSDDAVIASSGVDTSDFALFNYSRKDKKSISIFQGDNNTAIFGVTTK